MYNRICPNCNKNIDYKNSSSYYNAMRRNSICKSCRTIKANKARNSKKENNPSWKGYKNIPYSWFSRYFERKGKKRLGSITIENVYSIWISQEKRCKYSGIPIGFYDDDMKHTCSIDRIDSNKEYTLDNICLVHKDINIMKNKYDLDYFIYVCRLITKQQNEV